MARILIGWELGANMGHVARMRDLVDALLARGHHVAIALQRIDALNFAEDRRLRLWQAPVWPRLLANTARPTAGEPATIGDILFRLGLGRHGTLSALLGGWDAILAAERPDLVISDFAPALLMAARGRIRSIAIGTGFTCPPASGPHFPPLGAAKPAIAEDELLDTVDAELAIAGRPPLETLPALFASDDQLICSFRELDPYRSVTGRTHFAPQVMPPVAAPNGAGGDEIFVYGFTLIGASATLWQALAACGHRVRVHLPDPTPEHLAVMRAGGLIFEPKPLPFPLIAQRSRIVVSHGGLGFASSALLAGLPQVVTFYDLEKRLTAEALEEGGLGIGTLLYDLDATAFGQLLGQAMANDAMAARCRDAAAAFHSRMERTADARILDIAASV